MGHTLLIANNKPSISASGRFSEFTREEPDDESGSNCLDFNRSTTAKLFPLLGICLEDDQALINAADVYQACCTALAMATVQVDEYTCAEDAMMGQVLTALASDAQMHYIGTDASTVKGLKNRVERVQKLCLTALGTVRFCGFDIHLLI